MFKAQTENSAQRGDLYLHLLHLWCMTYALIMTQKKQSLNWSKAWKGGHTERTIHKCHTSESLVFIPMQKRKKMVRTFLLFWKIIASDLDPISRQSSKTISSASPPDILTGLEKLYQARLVNSGPLKLIRINLGRYVLPEHDSRCASVWGRKTNKKKVVMIFFSTNFVNSELYKKKTEKKTFYQL